MSGKLSGQIELLVDNIIMEKKQENAEVSLESVLSDLMCHQDMERKPKQVIRKIVEKILNDYYKKCKQIEID
jgi:Na+-translocating ferredoxin:NAD+ oxidoreductase RnfG subunit